MALIIPPGFLQAVYEMQLTGDSEPMVITMGHEIDSASGANGEDAADDLFGSFNFEVFYDFMASVYTLTGVTVYVGNDGPPSVFTSTVAPSTAVGGGTCVPPNTAYLIRKRTDLAGKRGRGRFYLPGVREDQVDNVGNVLPATQTVLNTALESWHDYLTGGTGARLYPPVVLHRSEGIGVEPPPTPITTFVTDGKVATQRRRLRP